MWRYCAEYFDKETGSYYLRERYYNPSNGRFSSEDPIRDGLNWYTYCMGNPVRFVDPSGLKDVIAADYAKDKGAKITWTGNTTVNGVVYATANVSYNGRTETITGRLVNDRLIYDDQKLNAMFGFGCNDPISVGKVGNTTYINVYVSIRGDGSDDTVKGTSITYRQAAIDGIMSNWGSSTVSINVFDVSNSIVMGQGFLPIKIKRGTGVSNMPGGSWESYQDPGQIILFQGDSRNNLTDDLYTIDQLGWVAAHEFGHAMGIGDAYKVQGWAGNNVDLPSIMNGFGTAAQGIDIRMVWQAYDLNSWQNYQRVGRSFV